MWEAPFAIVATPEQLQERMPLLRVPCVLCLYLLRIQVVIAVFKEILIVRTMHVSETCWLGMQRQSETRAGNPRRHAYA